MVSALKEEAHERMLAGKKDPTGELLEGTKGEATQRAGHAVPIKSTDV